MSKFDFSIIRTLRMKWGLSAEELAKRANVTRATVAKIESGDGNPTIETIESLSNVFQLTSSELIRLAEVAQCETAVTKDIKTGLFLFPDKPDILEQFQKLKTGLIHNLGC